MAAFGKFLPTPRLGAVLVVLLLAGCANDASSAPRTNGPPTAPADCNDLGTHHGDGAVLAGSDWSGEAHAYGEPATIYACALATSGGTVRFQVTGSGITVTPSRRVLSDYPSGVVPFRVQVSRGATGRLVMLQKGPGLSSGGPGPAVVADADAWHFDRAD